MKVNSPEKRLSKFWGKVDQKHINSFLPFIIGERVLDLGCGYGTTTVTIGKRGIACIGIDYDQPSIDYCNSQYPENSFACINAEHLPFPDNYFDTIVLRDALHHFYKEADFIKIKKEIIRVSRQNARVIFFDPNVNWLLKTMRKITRHKDEECTYEEAMKIMEEMNLKIIYSEFNTIWSLPLSGGYVGLNFVPNNAFIQKIILSLETRMESLIRKAGLGRNLCWRYLLVGEKKSY